MPVPRAEKLGILQGPGHAESPWEGFLLQKCFVSLSCCCQRQRGLASYPQTNRLTFQHTICQGFGKNTSFWEEWGKGVSGFTS